LPNYVGAAVVAFGVGAGTAPEAQAGMTDNQKVAAAVLGVVGVATAINHFSMEEIKDRIGNTELFISVDGQKTIKRLGLRYNQVSKTIDNPATGQKLLLSSGPKQNRKDIAVQVDAAKFHGTSENQLALTYIFVDEQGNRYGDNYIAFRDPSGIIKIMQYGSKIAVEQGR
jgi:hypothetical protein